MATPWLSFLRLVSQLIEIMALLTTKPTVLHNDDVSVPEKSSSSTVAQVEKPANQEICFNCAGVGHYRVCPSPVKPEAQRQKTAGNYRGP